MDENTKQEISNYLELLDEIKQGTEDENTAAVILAEIAKDRRIEQTRPERSFNGNAPATENQIAYLQDLGVVIPEGLTRQQASKLIDNAKASRQAMKNSVKAPNAY